MAQIYLGLGSNIERERYITAGLDALAELLGSLQLSPVYDSAAIGFDGKPFLNLVVAARTGLQVGSLARSLRQIETDHGRPAQTTRFSPRQLDIDILTYDNHVGVIEGVELPRGEILENAFVLRPLADLAPDVLHPVVGRSYASLWRAYNEASQSLQRVDFQWRGEMVSRAQLPGQQPV